MVFLASHTVAIVTYHATKVITCSPIVGQYFDTCTIIVASSDKEWI